MAIRDSRTHGWPTLAAMTVLTLAYAITVGYAMTVQSRLALRFEAMDSPSDPLPSAARWAIDNVASTPWFLLGLVPIFALALARSPTRGDVMLHLGLAGAGLIALLVWERQLYLGLNVLARLMERIQ